MNKFKTIKNKVCRMCESRSFNKVIDIGFHPLVNSLVHKKDIKKKILFFQSK